MKGIAGIYMIAAIVIGALLLTNSNFTESVTTNGPVIMSQEPTENKVTAFYNILSEPINTSLLMIIVLLIVVMVWL